MFFPWLVLGDFLFFSSTISLGIAAGLGVCGEKHRVALQYCCIIGIFVGGFFGFFGSFCVSYSVSYSV